MVINPKNLMDELQKLRLLGYTCENLYISDRANVIFDYHLMLDGLQEEALGENKIGTTKKGIGPAYTDKIARVGIRMIDFIADDFKERFFNTLKMKNSELLRYNQTPYNFDSLYEEYQKIANELRPYVTDTITLVHDLLDEA